MECYLFNLHICHSTFGSALRKLVKAQYYCTMLHNVEETLKNVKGLTEYIMNGMENWINTRMEEWNY